MKVMKRIKKKKRNILRGELKNISKGDIRRCARKGGNTICYRF